MDPHAMDGLEMLDLENQEPEYEQYDEPENLSIASDIENGILGAGKNLGKEADKLKGLSATQAEDYIQKNKIPIGIAAIGVGIFLCFFGMKFLSVVIFIIAAGAICGGSAYGGFTIADNMTNHKTQDWLIWVILVVSVLLGVGVGSYLMNYIDFGKWLIVGAGGAAGGLFLAKSFAMSGVFYWLVVVGCVIASCVLFGFIADFLLIVCTALVGSVSIVNGIMLFTGGYEMELDLQKQIAAGKLTWASFPKIFLAYLGGMIVLCITGAIVQSKLHSKEKESNAH